MINVIDIGMSLLTLTILEIVLGIDNLVFVAICSSRLPPHQQKRARRIGLALAWITRLILLGFAVALSQLTAPLFSINDFAVSGHDLFLGIGGLFLLTKAVQEIHHEIEPPPPETDQKPYSTFFAVVSQIAILDVVFSLDSVLTAIGLTDHFIVMAIAITIAIVVMILSSEWITAFINNHPTFKMLALSFLTLIGAVLIADACHFHVPKPYVYFSICFALMVEVLNLWRRKKHDD